jgi:hypothetical protein
MSVPVFLQAPCHALWIGAIAAALVCAPGSAAERLAAPAVTVRGVVAGTAFTPPAGTMAPHTTPIRFGNARVCLDANDDAVCGPGEAVTQTDGQGAFVLKGTGRHAIVAEMSAPAPGATRLVLRAAADAVAPSAPVVVTPLSTEDVRMRPEGRRPPGRLAGRHRPTLTRRRAQTRTRADRRRLACRRM